MARNRQGLRMDSRSLALALTLRFPGTAPVRVGGVDLPGHTQQGGGREVTVYGNHMAGGGREAIAQGREDEQAEVRFAVSYLPGITPACTLIEHTEEGDVEYNIRSRHRMGKNDAFIELRCTRAGR